MTNKEKEYFDDLKERIKKSRYVFYADFSELDSELEFLINIIEKQQKEIERKNKLIEKNRIALKDCLKYKSEEDYE